MKLVSDHQGHRYVESLLRQEQTTNIFPILNLL